MLKMHVSGDKCYRNFFLLNIFFTIFEPGVLKKNREHGQFLPYKTNGKKGTIFKKFRLGHREFFQFLNHLVYTANRPKRSESKM
jgi:hypothetical protein